MPINTPSYNHTLQFKHFNYENQYGQRQLPIVVLRVSDAGWLFVFIMPGEFSCEVFNFENANSASGKFGGVAGVFVGAVIWWNKMYIAIVAVIAELILYPLHRYTW